MDGLISIIALGLFAYHGIRGIVRSRRRRSHKFSHLLS